ncbi:MAG: 1-deoxy-D-xylulose-5-phosphate reductoisomerase [Rikenellaceae bacterium]|nr:1-deoxy-D-xylulose-5-phosphate reductoisomerase [Rikenellaceae bacterium]
MKQRLAILGSTGSIGRQTLDVVAAYPDLFEVRTLTAATNWELLCRQAVEFDADSVVIADKSLYGKVKEALADTMIKVFAGEESLEHVAASSEVDTVVVALVGFAGLFPTVSAIRHSKKIALANKETLVVAGEHVTRLSREYGAPIVPVDSEHSAIFQSLAGEDTRAIDKLILTASGGPFRNYTSQMLESVTPQQALAHPSWVMGKKITIDSATLMNKGFEVIEARWLFGVDPSSIEVAVHPGSVVHSMVQFVDGAVKAQLGTPDMRLPIQYALTFPERLPMSGRRLSFDDMTLSFTRPDIGRFPCLGLAYESMRRGGNAPCVVNAANEVAVAAFLDERIGFMQIPGMIESCLDKMDFIAAPSLDDYRECDKATREYAESLIHSR